MHRVTSSTSALAHAPAFTPALAPAFASASTRALATPWAPPGLRTRPQGQWMRREEAIMGRAVAVELWSEHGGAGEAAMAAVMAEMHRVDRATSTLKPQSELSRIQREAALGAVRLSDEMYGLLERALHFAALSKGAFDVVRPAPGRAWAAPATGSAPRRPTPPPAEARAQLDWRSLELDAGPRSLRFAHPGLRVDLAGLARAHAIDRCWALLQQRGVAHARITAGADTRVIGERRGRPWSLGVGAGHRHDGQVLALLPLTDRAVSICADDLGRAAPEGAQDMRCAAVLADDCVSAHAIAHAVLALGAKAGLRLVDRQPRVDALLVDSQGRLRRSRGLREELARAGAH